MTDSNPSSSRRNNLKTMGLAVDASAAVSPLNRQRSQKDTKLISRAVLAADTKELARLLEVTGTDIDELLNFWSYKPAEEGLPPGSCLHLAVFKGVLESVNWCLSAGADPRLGDGVGRQPLDVCPSDPIREILEGACKSFVPIVRHKPSDKAPAPTLTPKGRRRMLTYSPEPAPAEPEPVDPKQAKVDAMRARIEAEKEVARAEREAGRQALAAEFLELRDVKKQLEAAETELAACLASAVSRRDTVHKADIDLTEAQQLESEQAVMVAQLKVQTDDLAQQIASRDAESKAVMAAACDAVRGRVSKDALRELQALTEPPEAIKQLIVVVGDVLDTAPAPPVRSPLARDASTTSLRASASTTSLPDRGSSEWVSCRRLLRSDSFVSRLLDFQPEWLAASPDALRTVAANAHDSCLSRDAVAFASGTCEPLLDWVLAVVQAATTVVSSQRPDGTTTELADSKELLMMATARLEAAVDHVSECKTLMAGCRDEARAAVDKARAARKDVVGLRLQCGTPLSGLWDGSDDLDSTISASASLEMQHAHNNNNSSSSSSSSSGLTAAATTSTTEPTMPRRTESKTPDMDDSSPRSAVHTAAGSPMVETGLGGRRKSRRRSSLSPAVDLLRRDSLSNIAPTLPPRALDDGSVSPRGRPRRPSSACSTDSTGSDTSAHPVQTRQRRGSRCAVSSPLRPASGDTVRSTDRRPSLPMALPSHPLAGIALAGARPHIGSYPTGSHPDIQIGTSFTSITGGGSSSSLTTSNNNNNTNNTNGGTSSDASRPPRPRSAVSTTSSTVRSPVASHPSSPSPSPSPFSLPPSVASSAAAGGRSPVSSITNNLSRGPSPSDVDVATSVSPAVRRVRRMSRDYSADPDSQPLMMMPSPATAEIHPALGGGGGGGGGDNNSSRGCGSGTTTGKSSPLTTGAPILGCGPGRGPVRVYGHASESPPCVKELEDTIQRLESQGSPQPSHRRRPSSVQRPSPLRRPSLTSTPNSESGLSASLAPSPMSAFASLHSSSPASFSDAPTPFQSPTTPTRRLSLKSNNVSVRRLEEALQFADSPQPSGSS